ncbi:uncharacterized protein LOC124276027 [Haliotis rubra]|uniref:uncharacterized protein LOC124276027 n=1 Tax=Haliotis rubra TaxID=36100 RepID=UPI001EE58D3E|nr:uncharacterized protein LOC124276027 [Haliotis rubra]
MPYVLILFMVYALSPCGVQGDALEVLSMFADTSAKRSTKSHLHCAVKCMKQKECKLFTSSFSPETGYNGLNYKCILDVTPGNRSSYNIINNCMTKTVYVKHLPQALAGACQGHTCRKFQVCIPMTEGGYRCH